MARPKKNEDSDNRPSNDEGIQLELSYAFTNLAIQLMKSELIRLLAGSLNDRKSLNEIISKFDEHGVSQEQFYLDLEGFNEFLELERERVNLEEKLKEIRTLQVSAGNKAFNFNEYPNLAKEDYKPFIFFEGLKRKDWAKTFNEPLLKFMELYRKTYETLGPRSNLEMQSYLEKVLFDNVNSRSIPKQCNAHLLTFLGINSKNKDTINDFLKRLEKSVAKSSN